MVLVALLQWLSCKWSYHIIQGDLVSYHIIQGDLVSYHIIQAYTWSNHITHTGIVISYHTSIHMVLPYTYVHIHIHIYRGKHGDRQTDTE